MTYKYIINDTEHNKKNKHTSFTHNTSDKTCDDTLVLKRNKPFRKYINTLEYSIRIMGGNNVYGLGLELRALQLTVLQQC